jgi:hypothetical protein
MIISIGSKPITSDGLRKLGFALVDLATSVDRYQLQASQARITPTEKEIGEADRAASRALSAMRKARKLIEKATQ